MRNRFGTVIRLLALSAGIGLASSTSALAFEDQHSVSAIVQALSTPISAEALSAAREADDQLLSQGTVGGSNFYLVTDERLDRANSIAKRLLISMSENPQNWVVRVFDTNPPQINAFVVGGKYIYVLTGLIDEVKSDDELAFIISHEIGHSMLKHGQRTKDDLTTLIASIAQVASQFDKDNAQGYNDFSRVLMANYSRLDEQEADAIAVIIAQNAGYNPLRGAGFFSRLKQKQDTAWQAWTQRLADERATFDQSQANCQQWLNWYNSSWSNQTQDNANKINAICADAEQKRVQYNHEVEQYNTAAANQQSQELFSTHPADQSRVATIAALTDHVAGRRDLASLAKHQQTHRVLEALRRQNGDLSGFKAQVTLNATDAP